MPDGTNNFELGASDAGFSNADIQGGSKNEDRAGARKAAWHSAILNFVVTDPLTQEKVGGFKIGRRRCTHAELQKCAKKIITPSFMIDYLEEVTSGEVIYPEDAMSKCQPKPYAYRLVPYVERELVDEGVNEKYEGSLALFLELVPRADDSFDSTLTALDLREWLMFGIMEEHPAVRSVMGDIEIAAGKVEGVALRLSDVPFLRLTAVDDPERVLEGDEADKEREVRYASLLAEKELAETEVEEAKKSAELLMTNLDETEIVLTNADDDPEYPSPKATDTNAWYVSFKSPQRRFLEELAAGKTDWATIKLALGHMPIDQEGRATAEEPHPPWVGRGQVPDGSKAYFPNYAPYAANMTAVTVRRVQHGFGVHKTLPDDLLPFHGPNFEYYHGRFYDGKKHGAGLEYTDNGVYSGQYNAGQKKGVGRMDYANGDNYDGEFGVGRSEITASLLPGGNPYAVGLPHGRGVKTFADGSQYTGDFAEGRVTGRGRYESAMGEVYEGEFLDGELHGKGRVDRVSGEVYEGDFEHAEWHGQGTLTGKKGYRYEGPWIRGLRSGRAVERLRDGTEYEGFFDYDKRSGHGVMRYKTKKDDADLYKYEGNWLMGRTRTGGSHSLSDKATAYYYTYSKSSPLYPYLSTLQSRQDAQSKRAHRVRQRHLELDRYVRAECVRKKLKMFRQQRHHAKRAVREDYEEQYTQVDLDARLRYRKFNLDSLVDRGSLSVARAKSITKTNNFRDAARAVESFAEEKEAWISRNALSRALQSDFEELEERHRTINYQGRIKAARSRVTFEEEVKQGSGLPGD